MLTFDDGYSWLNKFENEHLSGSLKRLAEQAHKAWENGLPDEAHTGIVRLQQVNNSLNDLLGDAERAEICLACGQIYYYMGEYSRAAIEIRRAGNLYRGGYHHNRAVVNWLLGCVFWRQHRVGDAISRWERARRGFERIAAKTHHIDWYKARIQEMHETLTRAIDDGRWPPEENPPR